MKIALILSAATLLAACNTVPKPSPEPQVVLKEKAVPVATSCVPASLGDAPAYIDNNAALKAAAGPEDRYQLMAGGREQRIARLGELEPVVKSCRK